MRWLIIRPTVSASAGSAALAELNKEGAATTTVVSNANHERQLLVSKIRYRLDVIAISPSEQSADNTIALRNWPQFSDKV
ncbi:MAG: hypothetical protein ABGW78_01500 [Pirellulales bacterium]